MLRNFKKFIIKFPPFQEKLHTILRIIITNEDNNENANEKFKLTNICQCETPVHLLYNPLIIKNLNKFPKFAGGFVVGTLPPVPPRWLRPCSGLITHWLFSI